MNTQNQSNIVDYSDRIIFARVKSDSEPTATYYFTTPDDTSLEEVKFNLRGGAVTSTELVPRRYFVQDKNIQYFYNNGSTIPTAPYSGF